MATLQLNHTPAPVDSGISASDQAQEPEDKKPVAKSWHERVGTSKGYGLKCPGGWDCSFASISQTTTHMHGHHEATLWLAGETLGRELRARALSYILLVRRGSAG